MSLHPVLRDPLRGAAVTGVRTLHPRPASAMRTVRALPAGGNSPHPPSKPALRQRDSFLLTLDSRVHSLPAGPASGVCALLPPTPEAGIQCLSRRDHGSGALNGRSGGEGGSNCCSSGPKPWWVYDASPTAVPTRLHPVTFCTPCGLFQQFIPPSGPGLVSLLLTLSSPHQRPPIPSHASLYRFYAHLAAQPAPTVPLVSLAGGYNDTLFATSLTLLHGMCAIKCSVYGMVTYIPELLGYYTFTPPSLLSPRHRSPGVVAPQQCGGHPGCVGFCTP